MLDDWTTAAAAEVGITEEIPIDDVLDLARVAAHNVARPAAPVTTFLAGVAAGRAGGSTADMDRALRALAALAEQWVESPS